MTVRRLIEEELPLTVVNSESAREKHINHGHIGSMHRWWARRPLAMSRAVVLGTLLPDPGDPIRRTEILRAIEEASPFEAANSPNRINPLRKWIDEAYPDEPPKVLDCFAGGGAIPLEALRLGCASFAVELNPVAHLIEKCTLEYPQRFGALDGFGRNTFADEVVAWAVWVRERAEATLGDLFPLDDGGNRAAVYFWARTMDCQNPACRVEVPLISSCWLANSTRRTAWVELHPTPDTIELQVRTGTPPGGIDLSIGTVKASSVTCPACGLSVSARAVREYGSQTGFGDRLYAVMDIAGQVRTYRSPRPHEIEAAQTVAKAKLVQFGETPDGESELPDEVCDPNGFRRVQGIAFGFETWRSLFHDRQLNVLGTLCRVVREAHEAMLAEGMEEEKARAIATYLGFAIDKVAEHDSGFTTWANKIEASRGTFPRQAIPMVWDSVETYPFYGGGGIWDAHVRWIELAIRHCSETSRTPAEVHRGDAQALEFDSGTFDAVVVDPPYYDAIQYSYLSDFFYVWLKRSVGGLYPGLFATPATPKRQEVIQNQARRASPDYISGEEFDRRLQSALHEIARVTKANGVVSIVFAHTDVEAWERLLRAIRAVDLVVSTSWPMRSERGSRSNALLRHAVLASSVVLVCRPQQAEEEGYFDEVEAELERRIDERLATFEEMELTGADYFVSAVGPAFEVFARYKRVVRLSGEEVDVDELMVLARQAVARHAARRLLGGESLAALDDLALMYLTWRWAYDGEPIPADEAYKLGRAFDIDFAELTRPDGLVKKTGDTFHLLGPQERKTVKVAPGSSLVNVLQAACQLHDAGRRKELVDLLGSTGAGTEPGFWALGSAIAQALPDGDREKTMLLGLTANQETLAAAAQHSRPIEMPSLFGNTTPSIFGDDPPTLFEGSKT